MTVAVKSHPVPVPLKELFRLGVLVPPRAGLAVDNFRLGIKWL